MSIAIPGQRTWSITDFQGFAHAQPKSPDAAGTPAFPDGILGDLFSYISTVIGSIGGHASAAVNAAAEASSAAVTAQAVAGQVPTLSSATYNAWLRPNRTGDGYNLLNWTTISSTHGSTLAVGTHRVLFDTSGGPFRIIQQGTAAEGDLMDFGDFERTFGLNNMTFVFNATVAGSVYGGGATVVFDVSGDRAQYQFWSGKWREL